MRDRPRLIALDLDGTALDRDHRTVLPETLKVLQTFAENGGLVVPCTGRGAALVPKELLPYRYSITCNGAVIREEDQVLYTNPLDRQQLLQGLDILREYDVLIELFTVDGIVMERRVLESLDEYAERIPEFHMPFLRSGKVCPVDALDQVDAPVMKINLPKRALEPYPELADRIRELGIFAVESDGFNLELMNPPCDKGLGLSLLAEHLGIPMNNVIAFGDGWNDISMLRRVGCSVAMGNAREEVKAAAMFIAESNEQEGIAKFLQYTFPAIFQPPEKQSGCPASPA